jgi:hypothetical protein
LNRHFQVENWHIRAILGAAKAVALAFTAIFRTFDRGDQTFLAESLNFGGVAVV